MNISFISLFVLGEEFFVSLKLRARDKKTKLSYIRQFKLMLCARWVRFLVHIFAYFIYLLKIISSQHFPFIFFFSFLFHPIYHPRTTSYTLVLPPSRSPDPGSHRGPFFPLPTYGTCLHLDRENNSVFFSVVDSGRIVHTHAARCSQQLILSFLHFFPRNE